MKTFITLGFFVVQIVALLIGIIMMIRNQLEPNNEDFLYPAIQLFIIGTIAFLINQALFYLWRKNK